MAEMLHEALNFLIHSCWEPLLHRWPVETISVMAFLGLGFAGNSWLKRRPGYDRISLELHYYLETKTKVQSATVSTIKVRKNDLHEYTIAVERDRIYTHLDAPENKNLTVKEGDIVGDIKKFKVFSTVPFTKRMAFYLEGEFEDSSLLEKPRFTVRAPSNIKTVLVVIHLPPITHAKKASWSISGSRWSKPQSEPLRVWKGRYFAHTFSNLKKGLVYDISWEYDETGSLLDPGGKD